MIINTNSTLTCYKGNEIANFMSFKSYDKTF